MTKQEIFDQVWDLSLHRHKSMGFVGGKYCYKYRGSDNRRCFAGVFIPDEVYDPTFENTSFKKLIKDTPALEHLKPFTSFIQQLQEIHDSIPSTRWKEELTSFAKLRKLSIPSVV